MMVGGQGAGLSVALSLSGGGGVTGVTAGWGRGCPGRGCPGRAGERRYGRGARRGGPGSPRVGVSRLDGEGTGGEGAQGTAGRTGGSGLTGEIGAYRGSAAGPGTLSVPPGARQGSPPALARTGAPVQAQAPGVPPHPAAQPRRPGPARHPPVPATQTHRRTGDRAGEAALAAPAPTSRAAAAAAPPVKFRFSAEPPSFVSGTSPPPPPPARPRPAPASPAFPPPALPLSVPPPPPLRHRGPGRLQAAAVPESGPGHRASSRAPEKRSKGPLPVGGGADALLSPGPPNLGRYLRTKSFPARCGGGWEEPWWPLLARSWMPAARSGCPRGGGAGPGAQPPSLPSDPRFSSSQISSKAPLFFYFGLVGWR